MQTMIDLICTNCQEPFQRTQANHVTSIKRSKNFFCSRKCASAFRNTHQSLRCEYCGNQFSKQAFQIKKSKNHFCSVSCGVSYGNAHKTFGYQRSKLELWLEQKLGQEFQQLEVLYNNREIINAELDIYIPSLCLAFELNGIYHYEPIYGPEKLASTQNNDNRKFHACAEQGISLCVIDTSSQKYFKEASSQKYLDIIVKIISDKLKTED